MYNLILAFGMALEMPLHVVRKLFPQVNFLPLGGDEFNQAAILLMISFFVTQVIDFFKDMRGKKK